MRATRSFAAVPPRTPECRCGEVLDLSQPDPNRPAKLVGVCPGCRGWWVYDATAGRVMGPIRLTAAPGPAVE